jgi:HK97 family phage prohead protease
MKNLDPNNLTPEQMATSRALAAKLASFREKLDAADGSRGPNVRDGIPDEERGRALVNGACLCGCRVKRGDDGRIVSTGDCQCERVTSYNRNGQLKITTEPCVPTGATKLDAREHAMRETLIARATRDAVQSVAWRSDAKRATEPRPQTQGTVSSVDRGSRSVRILASSPDPVDGIAITSWDLTRFTANPVILWGHDTTNLPIGSASDVTYRQGVGLEMTITFASSKVTPLAEQVYQGVLEGVVKGASVGFQLEPDGRATLLEVSLVSVPADPNALVEDDGAARSTFSSEDDDDDEDDGDTSERKRFYESEGWRDEGEKDDHNGNSSDNFDALIANVERARRERDQRARDAWRTPAPHAAPAPTTTSTSSPRAEVTEDSVEAARRARDERMRDAWKR